MLQVMNPVIINDRTTQIAAIPKNVLMPLELLLLGLNLEPAGGGSAIFQNVNELLLHYMVLHPEDSPHHDNCHENLKIVISNVVFMPKSSGF
jgi:hypothetical protein